MIGFFENRGATLNRGQRLEDGQPLLGIQITQHHRDIFWRNPIQTTLQGDEIFVAEYAEGNQRLPERHGAILCRAFVLSHWTVRFKVSERPFFPRRE